MNIQDGLIFVMPQSAILGRKNCTCCGVWRYLSDFPYEKRKNLLYIRSQCRACERDRRRSWYANMEPDDRVKHNRHNYVRRVEGIDDPDRRVDAWPVRKFLLERMGDGESAEALAFRFDIDPHFVLDLARGYREQGCGLVPIRTVSANLIAHFRMTMAQEASAHRKKMPTLLI